MKTALLLPCLTALVTPPALAAQQDLRPGHDMARPCTTCHGLDGQRQWGDMPAIGGRDADELLYQLGRFQRAERFQPAMTLLLQTYDAAELVEVAAYFAGATK